MAENVEVIERIRDLIQQPPPFDGPRVIELSRQYNALVSAASTRLTEVCDCLQKGQRAQAINIAESAPVLLDLIAAIDFGGAKKWAMLAEGFDQWTLPPINAAMVEMLQNAYTHHEALEPLHKTYRRLSLKSASAEERLTVLRRIRQVDPNNSNCEQDIAALETLRIKEIGEALQARKPLTEQQAQRMHEELTRRDLSIKPSAALIDSARTMWRDLKARRVRVEMDQVVAKMNDGYAARDYEGVERCLGKLDEFAHSDGVPVPDKHTESVRDARAWHAAQLAEREKDAQVEEISAALSGMLDEEAPPAGVKVALLEIEKLERDPPAGLKNRARAYVQRHELIAMRKVRGKQLAYGAAALTVVALVIWASSSVSASRKRVSIGDEIRKDAHDLNFAAGDQVIAKLKTDSPELLEEFGIKQAIEAFETTRGDEYHRKAQFDQALQKGARADPFTPEMDALVAEAEKLALSRTEKDTVAEWKANLGVKRDNRARELADQGGKLLTSASETLNRLVKLEDPAAMQPLLAELDEVLRKAELVRGLPPEISAQVVNYRSRFDGQEKRAARLVEQARSTGALLEKSRKALLTARSKLPGDLKGYADFLHEKTGEFGTTAPEFKDVGKWTMVIPAYLATVEWGARAQKLLDGNKTPILSAGTYKDFRTELLKPNTDNPLTATPYKDAIESYRARANFFANAADKLKAFKALMQHDLMTKLCQFNETDAGGTLWYTHDKASGHRRGNVTEIEIFDNETLTPVSKNFEKITAKVECPHVTLGRNVDKLMDAELAAPNWISTLPQMLQAVYQSADSSVYIRALLYNRLLSLDAQSLKMLPNAAELQKKAAVLCAEKVSFWITTPKVKAQLDGIEKGLKDLAPDIAAALKQAAENEAQHNLEVIGLLRPLVISALFSQSEDGKPTITALSGVPRAREYWSIALSQSGEFEFRIAAITDEAGKTLWIDADSVHPGQPLLSPKDGKDTLALARQYIKAPKLIATPFPVNLAAVEKLK